RASQRFLVIRKGFVRIGARPGGLSGIADMQSLKLVDGQHTGELEKAAAVEAQVAIEQVMQHVVADLVLGAQLVAIERSERLRVVLQSGQNLRPPGILERLIEQVFI